MENKETILHESDVELNFPLFARKGNFVYEEETKQDEKYYLVGYEKIFVMGEIVYKKLFSLEPLKEDLGKDPYIFND